MQLGRLMEIASRDSQFREDAIEYVNAFGDALGEIHSMAVEANNPEAMESQIDNVDVSDSPALQGLIKNIDPSVLNKIQ